MTDSQAGSDSSELPGNESPGEGELQPSEPIFPDAAPNSGPVGDDDDGEQTGHTDEIAGDVVSSESAELVEVDTFPAPRRSFVWSFLLPGMEAGYWFIGALVAQVVGLIVGLVIGDVLHAGSELMFWSAASGGAAMLVFGFGGALIRFWPNIACWIGLQLKSPRDASVLRHVANRLGIRRISVGHVFAVIALPLPVQICCRPLVIWMSQLFPELGEKMAEVMEKLLHGAPVWAVFFVVAVAPALGEEVIFRGLIGSTLVKGWSVLAGRSGAMMAVLCTSLMFGAMHGFPPQAAAATFLGIAMHGVYLATKSFWAPMLLHFTNNAFAVFAATYASLFSDSSVSDETTPSLPLLCVAAATVVFVGTAMWKTRRQFRDDDDVLWDPGYVSVAGPPAHFGFTLTKRKGGALAIACICMGLASFVVFGYLLIFA